MSILGSVVQWGGTAIGAITGQPEIVGAAQAAGSAISVASGGSGHGPYVNGAPPSGWPYSGDWQVAPAPGQMSDIDIAALLMKAEAGTRSSIFQSYLATRPKAAPYMDTIVAQNPRLLGIAAAGGDDYQRDQLEANLWNVMARGMANYGIANYPQVSAGSNSKSLLDTVRTALSDAGKAAQDAAVASLTGSAVDAGMPSVQRNVARQASNNSMWIVVGVIGGILVYRVAFK